MAWSVQYDLVRYVSIDFHLRGVEVTGVEVTCVALQDVTNNPLWTGKDAGLAAEDEHMSKFMKKYEGFDSASIGGRGSTQTAKTAVDKPSETGG